LDESSKAHLAMLVSRGPPAGRRWWTMQLLADELVACRLVETISDESVRRALHNMGLLRSRSAVARRRQTRMFGGQRI
jgi:hypothetical protein